MTKYYTFADISRQYEKSHNFVAYGYRKAIDLFERGIITKDIRSLIIEDTIKSPSGKVYKAKIVHENNLKAFKELIQYTKDNLFIKPKENVIKKCEDWSEDSIYCYSIGCICKYCRIAEAFPILKTECRMKKTVLKLVRKLGKPN